MNLLAARDAQREAFDHIVLEVDKGYGTTYQPSIQTCLARKGTATPVFNGPEPFAAESSPRRAVVLELFGSGDPDSRMTRTMRRPSLS